jgi:hypothetical protein
MMIKCLIQHENNNCKHLNIYKTKRTYLKRKIDTIHHLQLWIKYSSSKERAN